MKFLLSLIDAFMAKFYSTKPKPMPEPVIVTPPVPSVTPPIKHSIKWCGGTLEERKAMYQLAMRVCAEEGLDKLPSKLLTGYTLRADVIATLHGESGMNQWCENHANRNGSVDYGVAQFNTGTNTQGVPYWIGSGAAFSSVEEVLNNPEKCIRVMAKEFKRGNAKWWYAYQAVQKMFPSSRKAYMEKVLKMYK